MKVKLDSGAIMPTRAHSTDAGLDLYSPINSAVYPGKQVVIDTGVHVAIPTGWVGLITSKSGLMAKRGITCRGTIDAGFTGSVKAVLFNSGSKPFLINERQKITQLVVVPCLLDDPELVDDLDDTERGDGGLGSTGE